jgi:protein ImuA
VGLRLRRRKKRLKLGVPPLDAILGGGLPLSTLTEIRARESRDGGTAGGFALALVARIAAGGGMPTLVWIGEAEARREAGGLYAPGVAALGLDPAAIIEVAARTEKEALWAFEAALSCRGLGVAVCELRQASLDLSATRRCALRARETGVTGFLLRLGFEAEPSAAELRFALSPAPAGTVGRFAAGIGRMAWRLTLEKNRVGPTGVFTLEWNSHERSFAERGEGNAYSQPLSAAARDGPPRPVATAEGACVLRRAS